ncbi:trans-1,2-dihydrobenzene-1,2-diol dehydrogenase [Polyodon spathula]|uniref:trans-1,2-dihydrobenzene-1,2-diol dehydrogenase n=1 Tax=Polyodon spathula TaxID=7913 RepID=UPI001B7E6C39|nr:trans-1,2-dihydrobenzene-1,2-diol dehydrogenase [Polyodon spathula]
MAACVDVIIVGAGNRGSIYAHFAVAFPERMRVVGVADPNPFSRERLREQHRIEEHNAFTGVTQLPDVSLADAVLICTPDRLHKEPAVVFAQKGYHILLEKPMAVTAEDCIEIMSVCSESQVMLAVCHVLRYLPAVQKIKELIDSGAIGDVIHIQHLEPVGFYHFAHSFVRGNWRSEAGSSFSLLAKSCHDIDLINYWAGGRRCLKVSSFGSLSHFTKDNQPQGASDRCLSCSVEAGCPYSAKKIYLDRVTQGEVGWPVSVLCSSSLPDIESVTEALCSGPYGRCVYDCDNDVCTNQVVNMQFEVGLTASFSMVAFTEQMCQRKTTISGSKVTNSSRALQAGDLPTLSGKSTLGRGGRLSPPKVTHHVDPSPPGASGLGGHGGGDYHLMDRFISAVASCDPALILSGPEETLQSHLLVFQAERARREGVVLSGGGEEGRDTVNNNP